MMMLAGQFPGDAVVGRQQRRLHGPELGVTARPTVSHDRQPRQAHQLSSGVVPIGLATLRPVPCSTSLPIRRHVQTIVHNDNSCYYTGSQRPHNCRPLAVNIEFIDLQRARADALRIKTVEYGWLGSRVVSVLYSGAEGPGFKSQPRRCRVTVLGKLFTPIVPLFTKQRN